MLNEPKNKENVDSVISNIMKDKKLEGILDLEEEKVKDAFKNVYFAERVLIDENTDFPYAYLKYFRLEDLLSAGALHSTVLAAYLHGQQKRETGKAYFSHPYRAALNLLKVVLKKSDIRDEMFAAAMLHDSLEDTNLKLNQLKEFGEKHNMPNLATIVNKLTRTDKEHGNKNINLDQIRGTNDLRANVENYRQGKVSYYRRLLDVKNAVDLEALLVKIFDGLDNLEEAPVPEEYLDKIKKTKEKSKFNKLFLQRFFDSKKWKLYEGGFFINNFLIPAYNILSKSEFLSQIGADNSLKKFINSRLFLNLGDEVVNSLDKIDSFYRITSSRITQIIKDKYNKIKGKTFEGKFVGGTVLNKEFGEIPKERLAYLRLKDSFRIFYKNELSKKVVLYVNKKFIDLVLMGKTNDYSVYVGLPVETVETINRKEKRFPKYYLVKLSLFPN